MHFPRCFLGQGIRNVATEQIDRVYESLDPEFEYQRERLNKDQAPSQPNKPVMQSSATQARRGEQTRKDDLSDLLSTAPSAESHSSTLKIKEGQKSTAFPITKLEYKGDDETDHGADAWGDEDAWGDDWGDQETDIKVSSPEVQAATSSLSPALAKANVSVPLSGTKSPTLEHVDKQSSRSGHTASLHTAHFSATLNSSRPPLAPSSAGNLQTAGTRSVKDLFSSDMKVSATQTQTKGSHLDIPGGPRDHTDPGQSMQRRPSADVSSLPLKYWARRRGNE